MFASYFFRFPNDPCTISGGPKNGTCYTRWVIHQVSFKIFWRVHFFCIKSLAKVFYNVNYVNVDYSLKNSTVDCKYLLFLQDFFFRLKPKQYKKCQYSWLFKKTIWKLIKNKVNIYNQQLNFWLNNWRLHNWRRRKPQL